MCVGRVPKEIAELLNLSSLVLGENDLSGLSLHSTMELLSPLASTLETLDLSWNKRLGACAIPGELLVPFTALTHLGFTGMELIGGLHSHYVCSMPVNLKCLPTHFKCAVPFFGRR
jgi:hypothetical protein